MFEHNKLFDFPFSIDVTQFSNALTIVIYHHIVEFLWKKFFQAYMIHITLKCQISLLFPYVRNEKPHTMDKFLYSFLCFISALAADLWTKIYLNWFSLDTYCKTQYTSIRMNRATQIQSAFQRTKLFQLIRSEENEI